jgi:O-antigen/teichoic acid export membrane protein
MALKMLTGTGVYTIAMVGQRVASLILLPVVTGHLTRAQYGALDLLEQIGIVVTLIIGVNLSPAIGYFYFKPEADRRRVTSTALVGSVFIGLLAAAVGLTLGMPLGRAVMGSRDYDVFLRAVFAVMPFSFLVEAAIAWVRTEDRLKLFVVSSLLRVGFIVAGTITLITYFGMGLGGVIATNFAAIVLTALGVTYFAVRENGLHFDGGLFRSMLRYSLPLSISGIAMFVVHFGDRFIIPTYAGLDQLGLYSAAYKFGMMVSLFHGSFQSYWSAQIFQIIRRPDAHAFFSRIFTYVTVGMLLFTLGLLVASRPAMMMLTAPGYWEAIGLIPIILGAYFLRAIGDYFRVLFLAEGKSSWDAMCGTAGAVTALAAYFLFIPRWGIWGAAFATCLSFLAMTVISIAGGYRLWPYHLEAGRLTKAVVLGAVTASLHFLLPVLSVPLEILKGFLLLSGFCLALFTGHFLYPAEKDLLRAAVQRGKQFLKS